jgi:hypothetical protein
LALNRVLEIKLLLKQLVSFDKLLLHRMELIGLVACQEVSFYQYDSCLTKVILQLLKQSLRFLQSNFKL